jgi:chromosome segregation ATPase
VTAAHPELALLESYLDRLRDQVRAVELELARLQATDERQTSDMEALRERVAVHMADMQVEVQALKTQVELLARDSATMRASQARTEATLKPMSDDLHALKAHVTRAAGLVAVLDLLFKVVVTKFGG